MQKKIPKLANGNFCFKTASGKESYAGEIIKIDYRDGVLTAFQNRKR